MNLHNILKASTYMLLGCGGLLKMIGKNEVGDLFITIAGGLGASAYSKGVNRD